MDKVQKIREEVVRIHNLLPVVAGDNLSVNYADRICTTLEMYIDSLQKEPVNESVDFEQELYKAFGQVKDFTLGVRIAKRFYDMGKKSREPVSEDLKEAVNAYIGYAPEVDECSSTYGKRQAFKAGAQWQKEQMMAKAVDGKVIANGMGNPILHLWDKGRHLIDKKVKVIIIKED